jgi:hypothetical protein
LPHIEAGVPVTAWGASVKTVGDIKHGLMVPGSISNVRDQDYPKIRHSSKAQHSKQSSALELARLCKMKKMFL